jgi:guanine deaminase
VEIVRAQVMHTPRDPFEDGDSLEAFSDGALAFADGRIEAVGSFDEVRHAHPEAQVRDDRDAILLPGFVDTHVHFPQLAIMGSMGLGLLDWLERYALPEEARMADEAHARRVAREFVTGLAANGTTTALVFGSHFPAAQEALFEEAERSGLRIASGLVVSDRNLLPELHVDPDVAYDAGRELAGRWHGRGRLRYAVTPRFSLSCSEGMLEACGALHGEIGALVTSHMNENRDEVEAVRTLFAGFDDYLHTYEHFGLVGQSTVLAHNDHPSEGELARLGAARASVAHCPESNAFLGSGLFPLSGHLDHGVRVALGTDVGAGTGLSVLKEALTAYQLQMLRDDAPPLGPAHLLHLSTRAGALALGLDEVGDLSPGGAADFVLLRPPPGSTLEAVLRHSDSPERTLGALFALAREESVAEVRVGGEAVSVGRGAAGQVPPGGAGGASPPIA